MRQKADNAAGLIVFIGARKSGQVLVKWTPIGSELELREHVQGTVEERMWVLGMGGATRYEVERFRAAHRKSQRYGYWFARTDAFTRAMAAKVNDKGRSARKVEAPTRRAA